ncbi:hypothetical protein [Microbacterium ulmi]|uniref:Uncharacterized protein n=1 Tax=Microbacterium ulmi TaxID=179095 RepID=A0A7Y2Q2L4_9MICO|nr:hypothetical protein [Microbacterium ulmi]NII68832.1 hypothetical protein [Microbacterium ulmi]NNH04738.1 hypothetical protein [Microbacterium ulmi]
MQSVVLDTPAGIGARLGWDPKLSEHDRKRILAKQILSARLGREEKSIVVERESPAQFGFHTQLFARIEEDELPVVIRTASFRGATVCAVAEPGTHFGLDLRDLHPDDVTLGDMKRGSHLFDEDNILSLTAHWTRVQAVREADGRGVRVKPDHVRLDTGLTKGWVPDRPIYYRILDLSRDGWVITLAYHEPEA